MPPYSSVSLIRMVGRSQGNGRGRDDDGGSPSLRRRVMTVTRTTLVNGSVFSSQAFSSSCSAETTAPSLRMQHLQDGELLGRELDLLAVAEDLAAVRVEA
ncbi:hypothetical protein SGLAM104S_06487 [Streptomyces glaucescens]